MAILRFYQENAFNHAKTLNILKQLNQVSMKKKLKLKYKYINFFFNSPDKRIYNQFKNGKMLSH